VNQNAGGDQRKGEKQAKLCESCRGDAERPSAAGEFDRKRIGELQCAEEPGPDGTSVLRPAAPRRTRVSENPSVSPTALTRNHKESASGT
jgi:hypothetical protein